MADFRLIGAAGTVFDALRDDLRASERVARSSGSGAF